MENSTSTTTNQTDSNLLTRETYFGDKTKSLILDDLSKRVFIYIRHLNQYAEGITGQSKGIYVHVNEGEGFKTKKEAKEVFKIMNKDGRYKGTKKSLVRRTPYGNIGQFYTIEFLTGVQLLEELEHYSYYSVSFIPNK